MNIFTIIALILGCGSKGFIELVGQLRINEAMMIPLGLILTFATKENIFKNKEFKIFLPLAMIMLISYCVTTLAAGAPFEFVVKRVSNVVFMTIAFYVFSILFVNDRKSVVFYLIGGCIAIAIKSYGVPFNITTWKTSWAGVFNRLILIIGFILPPLITNGSYIFISFVNFSFHARSSASMFFLSACSTIAKKFTKRLRINAFSLTVIGMLLLASGYGLLQIKEMFKTLNKEKGIAYQIDSKAGRLAAIKVALDAIWDSPIFGHGNPEHDKKLDQELERKIREAYEKEDGPQPYIGRVRFVAHSKILEAWLEGGLLAAIFFFVLIYRLIKAYAYNLLVRTPDRMTSLYFYFCINGVWHTLFSPFKGINRINTAITMAILCLMWHERRRSLPEAPAADTPEDALPD